MIKKLVRTCNHDTTAMVAAASCLRGGDKPLRARLGRPNQLHLGQQMLTEYRVPADNLLILSKRCMLIRQARF